MSHLPSSSSARTERMVTPVPTSLGRKQRGHSRIMMILCIGVPVVAIATLFAVGSSWMAWSTALFLLCPLVMGAMMFMMMRDQRPVVKAETVEDPRSQGELAPDKSVSSADSFKA